MTDFYAKRPGEPDWDLESTLLFMMTSFLKSRGDLGLPSNERFYDEDVNVYLAGLLASYVDTRFMERCGRYISPFDIDVVDMARGADERARYTIYKVNADHQMVMAGIFEARQPSAATGPPTGSRGPTYYQLAASYARTLARRETPEIHVFHKLSQAFRDYVTVLNHLRSEYFGLIERFDHRAWEAIHSDMDGQAQKMELADAVNLLLDAYNKWKASRDPADRVAMERLRETIRSLDPAFEFELPED